MELSQNEIKKLDNLLENSICEINKYSNKDEPTFASVYFLEYITILREFFKFKGKGAMDFDEDSFDNIIKYVVSNLPNAEENLIAPYLDIQKLDELFNMDDESFNKEKQKARDGDILNLHWNL